MQTDNKPLVYLIRYETSDEGTFGVWLLPGRFQCHTVELPWRDNRSNISCIPPGVYNAELYNSRKFGKVYHIQGVKGRTWILTHTGNVAGDKSKGFKTHSAGCILQGKYRGRLNGQKAVMVSRPTVRKFINVMGGKPFKLIVGG